MPTTVNSGRSVKLKTVMTLLLLCCGHRQHIRRRRVNRLGDAQHHTRLHLLSMGAEPAMGGALLFAKSTDQSGQAFGRPHWFALPGGMNRHFPDPLCRHRFQAMLPSIRASQPSTSQRDVLPCHRAEPRQIGVSATTETTGDAIPRYLLRRFTNQK